MKLLTLLGFLLIISPSLAQNNYSADDTRISFSINRYAAGVNNHWEHGIGVSFNKSRHNIRGSVLFGPNRYIGQKSFKLLGFRIDHIIHFSKEIKRFQWYGYYSYLFKHTARQYQYGGWFGNPVYDPLHKRKINMFGIGGFGCKFNAPYNFYVAIEIGAGVEYEDEVQEYDYYTNLNKRVQKLRFAPALNLTVGYRLVFRKDNR